MKTAADWLNDPSLYATSALALLTDAWGTDFLEWDPITVAMEIKSDFGVEPSEEILDRINAASTLFTSNLFQLSLEHFSAVCNALNFGVVTSDVFLPPDLDDVLWGVTEASILLGDMAEGQKFSHNIARYAGVLLSDAGIKTPPRLLGFAEFNDYEKTLEDGAFTDEIEAKLYYSQQEAERDSLEKDNNTKLLLLFRQISALPLKSGNADFIKERLARHPGLAPQ